MEVDVLVRKLGWGQESNTPCFFYHYSPEILLNCSAQAVSWKRVAVSRECRAGQRLSAQARVNGEIKTNVCVCGGKIYL